MKLSVMKRASGFGARYLQTAAEDDALSRQQKNDLSLAAAMLKAAPTLLNNVGMLCGAAEAGDGTDQTEAALMRCAARLRRAVSLGTDRAYGENPLTDVQ